MDYWEKFNETLLRKKENIYSHINMEDINVYYAHAKRFCKDFEKKKKVGEHHDLCVQGD